MTLTLVDVFCGADSGSQGAAAVPGITVRQACNHWPAWHAPLADAVDRETEAGR